MRKFNAVDYFWKNALSIEPLLSLENPNGPFSQHKPIKITIAVDDHECLSLTLKI